MPCVQRCIKFHWPIFCLVRLLFGHTTETWWCHNMEMLSALLALCVGNPLISLANSLFGQLIVWERKVMKSSHGNVFCITGPLWGESTNFLLPIHCLVSSFFGHTTETWWCHLMEMLSVLLAIREENPPVIGGFPSQRSSNVELWCLFVF